MRVAYLSIALLILFTSCNAQSIPEKEMQMETALLAAPEEARADATILGYTSDGNVVTLREGSNNYVCLADDPAKDGFNAACYFKDLEPFMARGRVLKSEGKSREEIFEIREKEVKNNKLTIPPNSTLYILTGKYDKLSKTLNDRHLRYVVYIPFATSESTGLPLKPVSNGGPWIMDPGTHRAHIMITPPKTSSKPE